MSHADQTLTACLERWAAEIPEHRLFTFADRALRTLAAYTWREFHERTNGLADALVNTIGAAADEPILLVYPPGLEMIAAFMACVKAGAIPVPVPAPAASSAAATERLKLVCADAGASRGLTDTSLQRALEGLTDLTWTDTSLLRGTLARFESRASDVLFLQYTSGSTQAPRGVMVTHENVVANSALTHDRPVGVSWLPHFHDLGLIGAYLFPMVRGGSTIQLSPTDFIRRPLLWLEAISRFGATTTAAPNFAFEYCLRAGKISEADVASLDLRTMRLMINGSEQVRPLTMTRFLERFAPAGLSPEALVASYGLAENTLCATSGGRVHVRVSQTRLERNELRIIRGRTSDHNTVALASCGKAIDGVDIRIVEVARRKQAAPGKIGEIWIRGRSKASGYWHRQELTREVFRARLADDSGGTDFLRSGDMGFFDEGELYVCGRIKDVVTIRGVNIYPEDIEAIVEHQMPASGRVAVFGSNRIGEDDDGIVILLELRPGDPAPDLSAVYQKVRARLHVPVQTIASVAKGSLATTSSGKTSRSGSRIRWKSGRIRELGRFVPPVADANEACPGPRIQRLLDLAGQRDETTIEELGLDSLELVTLSLDMEELFRKIPGTELLVTQVFDLSTLQSVSVGTLRRLMREIDGITHSGELAAIYRRAVGSVANRDAAAMLADAELPPATGLRADRPPPIGRGQGKVLLTGGTGFLGAYLLDALLRLTPDDVVVIARGLTEAHARQRVAAALARVRGIPLHAASLDARESVLAGDIAAPRLGLGSHEWDELAASTSAVMHSGAHIDYVKTYRELRDANVSSTRELIALCGSGAPKTLHHISTTFIFGWETAPRVCEDDFNPSMKGLDFGYAQSKWVAEQLVAAAGARGLDTRIYRPSFVTASRSGQYVREDVLVRLFSYMIRHAVSVDIPNQLSMLPVDVCAQNIIALAMLQDPGSRVFHLTADAYCTVQMACEAISERLGYAFEYLAIDAMVDHLKRFCGPDDIMFPLVAFVRNNSRKIAAMGGKRYDNRNYRAARAKAVGILAEPELDDCVSWIVKFLGQQQLIPPVDQLVHADSLVAAMSQA